MKLSVLRTPLAWLVALAALALVLLSTPLLSPAYARENSVPGASPRLATQTSFLPAAQNPTNNVIVALAPISRTSPVELVAVTLDANLSESDGHTVVSGASTFKLHNSDVEQPISLTVGFPEWAGGALSFDPAQFSQFQVTADNKKVVLATEQGPVKIGQETRNVNWWTFTLNLDPDEKQLVKVDFAQDLGTGIFPRFTYGLMPSNGWKGSIGSARLTIHLPSVTEGDQFIALDPSIPQFDGQSLNWIWTDFDPPADPGVTLIRFSTWNALRGSRAAVAQAPADSNRHMALARVYQQLASVETPRRDNFMSQAVAELETAARLNTKNVDAVLTLAELYETRAGPADGPRDDKYVSLALDEWKNLIGTSADAKARKQAGEDSFFLGVAARASQQNEQALSYFADAANFSPQGAGPLYTPERLKAETRAANLALANVRIQQDDIAGALNYARAIFGEDFDRGPLPALPSFALDHATVKTTMSERQIAMSLLAYPGPSEAAKQALDKVVAALNRMKAGQAKAAAEGSGYTITLSIPFSDPGELLDKMDKLGSAIPPREDWEAIRSLFTTQRLELSERTETFSRSVHYREELDLQTGESALKSSLDASSALAGQYESAPADDAEAQLKLALLKNFQQWFQRALATGTVSFQLDTGSGAAQHWTVPLGQIKTLEYDQESPRLDTYLMVAGGVAGALLFILLLFFFVRRLTHRRPAD